MTAPPDPALLAALTEALAGAWPAASPEDAHKNARAALEAVQPRDLIEAMLAVRILAAHHAVIDCYRRAMLPDVSDADAVRLRNNAIAASRSFDAALRTLEQRRSAPDKPSQPDRPPAPLLRQSSRRTPTPEAPQQPTFGEFTPEEIAAAELELDNNPLEQQRAELAKRIPLYRWQDMTMEERRIAYAPSTLHTPAQLAVLSARMAAASHPPPASASA